MQYLFHIILYDILNLEIFLLFYLCLIKAEFYVQNYNLILSDINYKLFINSQNKLNKFNENQ